jgi:hypothetical protein
MTDSGKRLREAARRLGSHQTSRILVAAVAQGVGAALFVLALFVALDRILPLPAVVRFLAFGVAIALPIARVGGAVFHRLPALRDLEEAARRTESEAGDLRQRLVPALQVLRVRDENRTGYSSDLVDAFVDDTVRRVDRVQPGALPYNVSVRRSLGIVGAGAAFAVVVAVVLGLGATGNGLLRLAFAVGELGPRPPAEFHVTPGDVSIPRGDDVTLSVLVENASMRDGRADGRLLWRADEESPWSEIDLTGREADGTVEAPRGETPGELAEFRYRFSDVRESFRYRFAHGGALSAVHGVEAVPHPSLTIDEVRYDYPEYTGLADRVATDGAGDLAAVKGTTARLTIRSTNEPAHASIILESGSEIPLTVEEGRLLTGDLVIADEDAYHLHIEDSLGLTNQNPLNYRVRALSDEAPFIRMLEPAEDRDLDEGMRVTLRFSAVDDYGLGPVRLVFELGRKEGDTQSRVIHRPAERRTELNERWDWDLADLGLMPGDTVTYHLEVKDNNAVDGPSTARTREYLLRFPTLGEIFAQIDEKEEASIEDLEDILSEAKRVEEKVEELSREILKKGESSWENRKEVERALETQEKLSDQLQELQEEISSNMDRLNESEFATLEAMQKMEQIQKLLDEVATEEMKEALDKLREAMEEMNARRFQMNQEEMSEQLERILENLKQFRLEEKMKAAVRELEELAARQERVNEELDQLAQKDEGDPKDAEAEENAEEGADEEGAQEEGAQEEGAEGEGTENEGQEGEELAQADEAEKSESQDAESSESESSDSESQDGESDEGENSESGDPSEEERADASEKGAEESGEPDPEELERLAREEEALAEEARRMEETMKELAEMVQELRDSADQKSMQEMSEQMESQDIPSTMDEMAENMQKQDVPNAQEKGEKALTQLQDMLSNLSQSQMQMQQRMMAINQAAINRAVRDLLSLSSDEELLALHLETIPRNSTSATRSFADEQYLLIQGAERVEKNLQEVAKDTPLMDSAVGQELDSSLDAMRDAAYGLENGAVHLAQDDGTQAVESMNAVVIELLQAAQAMSSCSTGMPMSSLMQQLQDLAGDQQKLNQMLRQMMKEGGKNMDERLKASVRSHAQEQQRIREQLSQLLEEIGEGQGFLGRLDDVERKLDEAAEKMAQGEFDEGMLREQEWALTRLLDAQRSIRERDFGKERRSNTAEELAELLPPSELPPGLDEERRDLREDLLKALDRRYPPKYEELIRRYFRSLTDEAPVPDLP